MLTASKLTDMWQGGYCSDAILHASTTSPGESKKRRAWLAQHLVETKCPSCINANVLKCLEMETAQLLGTEAVWMFFRGENITHLPNFSMTLKEIMQRALDAGNIDQDFLNWMRETTEKRAGKPWPGLNGVDTEQPH